MSSPPISGRQARVLDRIHPLPRDGNGRGAEAQASSPGGRRDAGPPQEHTQNRSGDNGNRNPNLRATPAPARASRDTGESSPPGCAGPSSRRRPQQCPPAQRRQKILFDLACAFAGDRSARNQHHVQGSFQCVLVPSKGLPQQTSGTVPHHGRAHLPGSHHADAVGTAGCHGQPVQNQTTTHQSLTSLPGRGKLSRPPQAEGSGQAIARTWWRDHGARA